MIYSDVITNLGVNMNLQQKFLLAAGAIALTSASNAVAAEDKKEDNAKEKCYGVVKAGKNGCASANGSHSCAGSAKTDGDPNEWVYLPKGTCDLLANGSLTVSEKK
jgi:uncharacterized membrane protein